MASAVPAEWSGSDESGRDETDISWLPPLVDPPAGAPSATTPPGGDHGTSAAEDVPALASAAQAVRMALASLRWLADADAAGLPVPVQADCLRELEQVQAVYTAAHASILAGFAGQAGYTADGQGSPRTWLLWRTRVTSRAASASVGWMRRLAEHPAVAAALRDGAVSASWARLICEWTDRLPPEARGDADAILLAAAAGGASLADLADLIEEMLRHLAKPDKDGDADFDERNLKLVTTLGGAGRLTGDLTASCAAALTALFEALGKRAGPEDVRTAEQRHHDALEEAARRLTAAGGLPDRAGQPTQIQLHMTLDDLARRMASGDPDSPGPDSPAAPGPGSPGPGWPGTGSPGSGPGYPGPGYPAPGSQGLRHPGLRQPPRRGPRGAALAGPPPAPGQDCDASIAPIVTGRIDHALLNTLATQLSGHASVPPGWLASPCATGHCPGQPAPGDPATAEPDSTDPAGTGYRSWAAARQLILTNAVALLSGPDALTSWLRTGQLTGPAASISLPLDVGTVTDTIPPHLRRAVITRDRHCRYPGCDQPPPACQVHHVRHRSDGGPTTLTNLLLLCTFHHLILIHRWNWTIMLNPDGTTTATSPTGRQYHSHSPPPAPAG